MAAPTKVTFPSFQLQVSGEVHAPAAGSADRKGAAIVVSHPMTGVKEQTSTDYARVLAKAGFYALTFDAAYQGESTGEPRGLEDPHQRVEDIKAAVTYLTTLTDKIDSSRIGVLGICASGGYASYAAQSDSRIKALATVSGACVGRLTRGGGAHEANAKENPEAIAGALKVAGEWRTEEARSKKHPDAPKMFDVSTIGDDPKADDFFKDAAQYYGNAKRGQHPRSNQKVPLESYDLMVSYDSFNFQHLISPRPLLMIAGEKAQTLHYSKSAIESAREPKELLVVKGLNHFDLYDNLEVSGPKLVDFFGKSI